jgi:SAM-dependent methyltransferase
MLPTALPSLRLFLISALLLLFELVLIRYLGTEIPAVGFFKNLILIAAFLGMGVGLNVQRLSARGALTGALLTSMLPLALVLVTRSSRTLDQLFFAGLIDEAVLLNKPSAGQQAMGIALLCAAFASCVPPFIYIGRLMGLSFDAVARDGTPLRAYGWNILGSLAGTLLFTLLSFLSVSPRWWLGLCAALMLAVLLAEAPGIGRRWTATLLALLAIQVATLVAWPSHGEVWWTPYYKVTRFGIGIPGGRMVGNGLNVNNTWFQQSYDVEQLGTEYDTIENAHAGRNLRFITPFRYAQPDSVLVLGSGLGNDTAAALKTGASRVTAVDIDPQIVRLSDELHPNRPYADPAVRLVVDDARHFLTCDDGEHDLILFGVLEARSLFSHFSNLRLDNYVYTREGLEIAYRRLSPDGTLWLNIWVPAPWVLQKFIGLMRELSGDRFMVLQGTRSNHYSLVTGPRFDPERLARVVADVPGVEIVDLNALTAGEVTVPTDSWPYIFYRRRTLPIVYLALLGMLIVLSVVPLWLAYPRLFSIQWPYFCLGGAFLLIESNAVVRMALLAGTTWLVNACVFAGVMIFIFLSNWAASRWRFKRLTPLFLALLASLAFSWALPFHVLLPLPNALAITLGAIVLTLPVFFSGCIFSTWFRATLTPSRALGSNVFGAVMGGLAEYFSMLLGNRSMIGVVMFLYVAAWFAYARARGRG